MPLITPSFSLSQSQPSHTPATGLPAPHRYPSSLKNSRLHITGQDPAAVMAASRDARTSSDAASVLSTSTFSSTMSLLKSSLKPKSSGGKESKEAKELRKREEKEEKQRRRQEEARRWKAEEDAKTREFFLSF